MEVTPSGPVETNREVRARVRAAGKAPNQGGWQTYTHILTTIFCVRPPWRNFDLGPKLVTIHYKLPPCLDTAAAAAASDRSSSDGSRTWHAAACGGLKLTTRNDMRVCGARQLCITVFVRTRPLFMNRFSKGYHQRGCENINFVNACVYTQWSESYSSRLRLMTTDKSWLNVDPVYSRSSSWARFIKKLFPSWHQNFSRTNPIDLMAICQTTSPTCLLFMSYITGWNTSPVLKEIMSFLRESETFWHLAIFDEIFARFRV